MTQDIFLATSSGLLHGQGSGFDWDIVASALEDKKCTTVAISGKTIFAGTTNGIYRSSDHGQTWLQVGSNIAHPHLRWLAIHPDLSDLVFAGTEPAAIYVSTDGGERWANRPEVEALRDRLSWFLPYSPEAGCVRGFAFHGSRIYAAVEVGGLLLSDDKGQTWQLAEASDGIPRFGDPKAGSIHPDVHSVASHPSSQDLVFAPTGGGYYVSRDGGLSFQQRHPPCYCRAVWIDPADSQHMVLGPASGVDREGRVKETVDGGESWQAIEDGLETPWSRHMVERFVDANGHLLAVLSNGELYAAANGQWRWRQLFPNAARINAIAVAA